MRSPGLGPAPDPVRPWPPAQVPGEMLTGTCHCAAVRIDVPRRPRTLTACNCTLCRRYGVRWAYYRAHEVHIEAQPDALDTYAWGPKALRFLRCATCGCVVCWQRIKPRKENFMGVNALNFDPVVMGAVRVRRLDGADTWKYLD